MKKQLDSAVNEKDVENIYRAEFQRLLPNSVITSPYGVDGLLEYKKVRSLLEFKFDVDLKSRKEQANIFIQIIYYLKRFEQKGYALPTTLFVGDNNECFALESSKVIKFLNREINWELAPSSAYKQNPELIKAIVQDVNIAPMVFDVNESFRLRDIINTLQDLSEGKITQVAINQQNIVEAFRYWKENVLLEKKLSIQEEAAIFIYCLVDNLNTYLHPKKPNILVTNYENRFKEINVKSDIHRSFFSHFKQDYQPSEIQIITGSKDRLIEEDTRRREGEFYTPTIWVYEAERLISSIYGKEWKEKYVVWDCASGLNNLTRDFVFANLFSSTLNIEDIETVKKMGYNPEAVIFQFDFLNDPLDKLPNKLIHSLQQNLPLLFFINPPFATPGVRDTKSKPNKSGTSNTMVNSLMKQHKFGRCCEQLYAQFLFRIYYIKRIYQLSNVNICFFSKPTFLVSPTFQKFRKMFFQEFEFKCGMLLRANHFSDVSDEWGVSFTIWSSGKNKLQNFNLDIKDINKINMKIETIGVKTFYLSENNSASKWARDPIKGIKTIDAPQLSNPINVKQKGSGKIIEGGLGYMHNNSNNVMQSSRFVGLYSSAFSDGHGIPIGKENFLRIVALFAARKSVEANWINDKDEFFIPDIKKDGYSTWNHDAIIYSLFNPSSNQSSLRNITYKGKLYNIRNHFFFLSNTEMKILADEYRFLELYRDTIHFPDESFIYPIIQTYSFSPIARDILEHAKFLFINSFPFRKTYHYQYPNYHLSAWDAGWYQIRMGILQQEDSLKKELNSFLQHYKEFESYIREGVYKFGFLKE